MTLPAWLALPLVVVAGMLVAFQAPINGAVGRALSNSLVAAAISFGVGFVALLVVSLLFGGAPAWARIGTVQPWLMAAGLCGAFYVWASIVGVTRLGVVTTMAALILGQTVAALLLDAGGYFGLPVREITPARLASVALVAGGLLLSRF